MENFERFCKILELDKDGTWFVILIIVLLVLSIIFIKKGIERAALELSFYRHYGTWLFKYCKENDIYDVDLAFKHAEYQKHMKKTLRHLIYRQDDFYIPNIGITMDEAVENVRIFLDSLNGGDSNE